MLGTWCDSVLSVTSITLMEVGILPNAAILLLLSRVFFLVVTLAYYYQLGRKLKKIWAAWLTLPGRRRRKGGAAEHRRGTRRCGILFDRGLERCPAGGCPLPWDLAYCNPRASNRWAPSHIPDSPTRLRISAKVNRALGGQAPPDAHIPPLCSSQSCL